MTKQPRKPKGAPTGGEWGTKPRSDSERVIAPEIDRDINGLERGRGGFPRDGRGNALVVNNDGEVYKRASRYGKAGDLKYVPYKSASSFTDPGDRRSITDWRKGLGMQELARNPELIARMQQVVDEGLSDSEERKKMLAIAEEAETLGGASRSADRGTHIHIITEHIDQGLDWDHLSENEDLDISGNMTAQLAQDWSKMNDDYGFKHLMVESAVVNDELHSAGTCDRMVEITKPMQIVVNNEVVEVPAGTRMIADVKTSKHTGKGLPHWGDYTSQLAIYARAVPYDTFTAERGEWPDNKPPSRRLGLILHVDMGKLENDVSDSVTVYGVDLRIGEDYCETVLASKNAAAEANKSGIISARPIAKKGQ